jgi:hypothetical protein
MDSFEKKVMQYAKSHPEDVFAEYFIKSYEESERMRKEDAKRWKEISDALLHISYRTTKMSIKSGREVDFN